MSELSAAVDHTMHLAQQRKMTVITVESCTAGALACALAEAEGASDTLQGGFVVYTKTNKSAALGVPRELIEKYTAVSAPVAKAMATAALIRSPADISLAITGVAGPEPDEDGNPVGLAFVAAAARDGRTLEERLQLSGCKQDICRSVMLAVLRLADKLLLGEP
jgi:nicotinamide-nucleotide amidase